MKSTMKDSLCNFFFWLFEDAGAYKIMIVVACIVMLIAIGYNLGYDYRLHNHKCPVQCPDIRKHVW